MEIWKKIEAFDGYEVSNLGRVRRWHRWQSKDGIVRFTMLKPNKLNKKNYWLIRLSKDGKQYGRMIHRLVADAFLPNPQNYPLVMHLDDNGFNNNVKNLKWGTVSQNTKSAWEAGLIHKRTKKTNLINE
jgi:hypothetical protein